MDPMQQFRLAHRQFMMRLQEAHEELVGAMARLCPSAIGELNSRLAKERQEQGLRYALNGLLIENPRAPIELIWADYQYHLKSRKAPPREARTPVQARSLLKWQRIIDATVSRLKTGEVIDTTSICKALELSVGTLYQFFPSTDDLISKAYEALFGSLLGSGPDDELANDPSDE